MSRDYKPNPERRSNAKKGSPFLTGLLIGFLLGIASSLAVVMYIKGGNSPLVRAVTPDLSKKIVSEQAELKAKEDVDARAHPPVEASDASVAGKDDKTRFDFYNILPGSEGKVAKGDEVKLHDEASAVNASKSYFLQVGAFQTEEEADNMKAKLALLGFEALVQTAAIPDKGVWHRVRVGPLKDLDQINKTKADLISNGFNPDLIKVNDENQ